MSRLHEAAIDGNLPLVRKLLKENEPIDMQDGNRNTALCIAVESGYRDLTEFLLNQKADPTIQGIDGKTPIHQAIFYGQIETGYLLLENPRVAKKYVNIPDDLGDTPLHTAMRNKSQDFIEKLLRCGASISATNYENETPFKIAEKDKELVRFVTHICKEEKDKIVKRLPGHANPEDVYSNFTYAQNGDINSLSAHLQNANEVNRAGHSLLFVAVQAWQTEVVQFLLNRKADVNVGSTDPLLFTSPLHYAAMGCNVEMVKILVENGANIENLDYRNHTPLHLAAEWKRVEILKYLLEQKADPNKADVQGFTPLHKAAATGRLPIVRELLNASVNVDAQDNNGNTPLHLACMWSWHKAVRCLIEEGKVNKDATNKNKNTPMHIAATLNKQQIVSLLLELGCEKMPINCDGFTPFHLAKTTQNEELIKLLKTEEPQQVRSRHRRTNSRVKQKAKKQLLKAIGAGDLQSAKSILKHCKIKSSDLFAALFYTARTGKADAMELILSKKEVDLPSLIDENGQNLLHVAVFGRNQAIVSELLMEEVDANLQDKSEQTPLHIALSKNNIPVSIIKELCGCTNLNIQDNQGNTPLHTIISADLPENELLERLDVILSHIRTTEELSQPNHAGNTPLHCAILRNDFNFDCVNRLIESGANLDICDNQQRSPLYLAAYRGLIRIATALVYAGADVDNPNSLSPLSVTDRSVVNEIYNAVEDIKEAQQKVVSVEDSEIFNYVKEGDLESVMNWIEQTECIDVVDVDGSTVLHSASYYGMVQVVQMLLKKPVNVNAYDENYQTPLHLAAMKGHTAVVDLLLQHQADVTAIDSEGQSPLDWAHMMGFSEIITMLESPNN